RCFGERGKKQGRMLARSFFSRQIVSKLVPMISTRRQSFRLSVLCLGTAMLFLRAQSILAQAPAEPLAWPPGYFNARPATDPAKPQPATVPGELKLARTHHSISIE